MRILRILRILLLLHIWFTLARCNLKMHASKELYTKCFCIVCTNNVHDLRFSILLLALQRRTLSTTFLYTFNMYIYIYIHISKRESAANSRHSKQCRLYFDSDANMMDDRIARLSTLVY